jgi:hypothetical protein
MSGKNVARRFNPGAFFVGRLAAMVAHKKVIAPAQIAEAKRLYEQTLTPMLDIAAMLGIARSTLNNRVREWKWVRRSGAGGAVDIARVVRGNAVAVLTANADLAPAAVPADFVRLAPVSAERRAALAARIQAVAEREMDVIERVVQVLGPADEAGAERVTRTLARVSRTLREVAALNQPDEVTPPDDADADPLPRDIDEFRNELARRIRGIIAARKAAAAGGDV